MHKTQVRMKIKKLFFQILFTSYCFGVEISCSPTTKSSRLNKISEQKNSLYVRDVMRLSKSAEMRNYMNELADPCKDFYEFACGKWDDINPIYEVGETGYFMELLSGMERKKMQLLNSNSSEDALETTIDRKVKDFYQSCMQLQGTETKSFKQQLIDILAEFGTMPALAGAAWNESEFDWLETIAKINKEYHLPILFVSFVLRDLNNNTKSRLYLGKGLLKLESKSMYLDEKNAKYRQIYKKEIATELTNYLELHEKTAENVAEEIVDLEVELARGFMDDKMAVGLGQLSLATTVQEMHEKYAPTIDIIKFVNISYGEVTNEPIFEFVEKYQKNLKNVIEVTPKKNLANYIFFKLLTEFIPEIGKTIEKQSKICVELTETNFPKNLENMIYRRYNTKSTEHDVSLIWQAVRDAFKRKLLSNKLNWLSFQTRQHALEKVNTMRIEINAYLDTNFTAEYAELEINTTNFLQNLKNIYTDNGKKECAKLYEPKPPNVEGLSYTPAYVLIENVVKIPVALLQPNYFWSSSYPKALTFGTLGTLLGHELIHGFDDTGREFDKDGNQKDWFDESSSNAFRDRTKCFTNQYEKYKFGGQQLPRSEKQSENIADNGGLQLAYDAYLQWRLQVERDGEDLDMETLPFLKYTDKQLFFISFAQISCTEMHPLLRGIRLSNDEHTPAPIEVIGTLSNFEEFSKEFNCAVGSLMNPQEKCQIY